MRGARWAVGCTRPKRCSRRHEQLVIPTAEEPCGPPRRAATGSRISNPADHQADRRPGQRLFSFRKSGKVSCAGAGGETWRKRCREKDCAGCAHKGRVGGGGIAGNMGSRWLSPAPASRFLEALWINRAHSHTSTDTRAHGHLPAAFGD